jgi:hypothetical protein
VFIMHRIILPRRLSLTEWRLRRVTCEASQPAQIVAKRSATRAAIIRAKFQIQHLVHRLDAPITADRLAESLKQCQTKIAAPCTGKP